MRNLYLQQIAEVLKEKSALIIATEHVAGRAENFYKNHIAPAGISKAQMAAVGNCLRRAGTMESAQNEYSEFLNRQMEKLKKREDKGAKPTSWRKRTGGEETPKPVGETLLEWFDKGCYLPQGTIPSLDLLQRFWHQIEILYHYHAATGNQPIIHKEICP